METNWLTTQVMEFIGDCILSFIEFFQEAIVELFDKGTNFAKNTQIVGAINATTLVGVSLVSIMVLKEIINVYILETDGDPENDPIQLLVKASQTICVICCNDFIYDQLSKVSKLMSNDINASVTPEKIFVSAEQLITQQLTKMGIINVLFILVYLGGAAVLAVKAGLRGIELAVMKMLLPIFAVDIVTVSSERYNAFVSSYFSTFFGYIIQMFAFNMSILSFVSAVTSSQIDYIYAGAWLYFSLNTPKWLEKYVYSSGLSKVVKGGMGGGMQLSYLARMAK